MLQFYQNHVVFQSFSDLYHLEQRSIQSKARKEMMEKSIGSTSNTASAASPVNVSESESNTPSSSRAPSLFHDLTRSSSNSSSDANSIATIDDDQQQSSQVQYYPEGLYNSTVETRLANKESDLITLHDAPIFQAGGIQDLSLRRF